MRICVPTTTDAAMQATVCDHFGGAPFFTVYDTETGQCLTLGNGDHDHEHGRCNPVASLTGANIDVVACRGLGARALHRLTGFGMKVVRTTARTVEQVVTQHESDSLEPIDPADTCQDHNCH